MSETGFNGYKNYETWCVSLWLSNEQAIDELCRQMAAECRAQATGCWQVREGIWPPEDAPKFLLADRLSSMIDEENPLLENATLYTDLLCAALSEVDWHEVADAFLEE